MFLHRLLEPPDRQRKRGRSRRSLIASASSKRGQNSATIFVVASFNRARRGKFTVYLWENYRDDEIQVTRGIWRGHITEPNCYPTAIINLALSLVNISSKINVFSISRGIPRRQMKTLSLILVLAAALAWRVLAPSFASASDGEFDRVVVPVGKSPAPIAIADVNHDGNPDIIVGNSGDQTVSVLLNDGHRHFTPAADSPFPCGQNPNDIAVGDLNGDGNPDLIIANTGTPYITILLGDGKGGFKPSPHSPFATTVRPHVHGIAIGDFMGDGKPAVVTDSWANDQILLIPSDGQGNLLLPGKFFRADIHTDSGVRAAQFTHSGHLDIVTTSQRDNAVGLMLGNGQGGFRRAPGSPFPAGLETWSFTVGDINGDGNPDVIVFPYQRDLPDPSKLGVTVLLGDGKGGFTAMPGSPLSLAGCQGPDKVGSGDVFGDGLRDIVVSCAQNDKLFIFRQLKGRTFSTSNLQVPTDWSGLAVGTLDSSGKDAIIVSNNSSHTVTILFNRH